MVVRALWQLKFVSDILASVGMAARTIIETLQV